MHCRSLIEDQAFMGAIVEVRDIEVRPAGPTIMAQVAQLDDQLTAAPADAAEERRSALRRMLRHGRYRPSGRSKPAQEYLRRQWDRSGELSLINNVVDVNNIVSLRHGLPMSVFDVGALRGALTLRRGREGERYVFNAGGQELDCQDLLVVCDDRGPVGSPVKDSRATKVFPGATHILYVLYGSPELIGAEEILAVAAELGQLLVADCSRGAMESPTLIAPL